MNFGKIILLIIISLLLSVSVMLAQLSFRIERTMLSFSYTSAELDQILSPLYDPGIHRETVDGTWDFLRKELSVRVPSELNQYIVDAAVQGFSPDWFTRTSQRMLFNIHQVLGGRSKSLSLPVSINSFKNAFMENVRGNFETEEYLEIDREITQLPSALDLAEEIPDETLDKIVVNMGRARLVLTLLQYAGPGLLILLCFAFRRAGSGLAALGIGFFIGGTGIAVAVTIWSNYIGELASNGLRAGLPRFLGWVDYGVKNLVTELLSGMLPVSIVVIIFGLLFSGLGVYLLVWKQDPEIRIPGGQH